VRIADVQVGLRYRVDRGPGARVCVLDKVKGRGLLVTIEAGSVWDGESWVDAGSEATMQARDLTSTWSEYGDTFGDGEPPEPVTWTEERARQEAEERHAPELDPDRLLPAAYEHTQGAHRRAADQLTAEESETVWTSAATGSSPRRRPGTGAGLLAGLPLAVARDLLAAFQSHDPRLRRSTVGSPSRLPDLEEGPYVFVAQEAANPSAPTVATVFERAARTLEIAVDDADGGLYGTHYPTFELLTSNDALFADECRSALAEPADRSLSFDLPAHLAELAEPRVVDALGWAPIAAGVTSGRRLHQPGCRVLREGRRAQLRHASVVPLW
jgi:hypothetical protein